MRSHAAAPSNHMLSATTPKVPTGTTAAARATETRRTRQSADVLPSYLFMAGP